jgi:hypothetical protein
VLISAEAAKNVRLGPACYKQLQTAFFSVLFDINIVIIDGINIIIIINIITINLNIDLSLEGK